MDDIAKQTWEKLEEMFGAKSLHNKLFLKKELHSLKIDKNPTRRAKSVGCCESHGLVIRAEGMCVNT
ncbi:unnamed protein product [Prunus armeniaca]